MQIATLETIDQADDQIAVFMPCLACANSIRLWKVPEINYAMQPVLMVGVVFTALSTLLFGLSDSFAMAVSARVLGGLFSSTGV